MNYSLREHIGTVTVILKFSELTYVRPWGQGL